MQRFLVAIAATVLLSLSASTSALAGTEWCVVDPVLNLDGRTSDVQVSFYQSYVPEVQPPVTFKFHVPSNSSAVVAMPAAQVTYTVEIVYDQPASKKNKGQVTVETFVGADTVFQTQTVVKVSKILLAVYGASGSTTTITYSLR